MVLIVEALNQSLMDFQLSCTSPLPWIWAVETLAHSNQVDISLLIELLEKIPRTSNDVGRHARELVSLKILEFFLIHGAPANPVSSVPIEKIGLDPLDNCEDVLQRILTKRQESPSPSCLKPSDLEISKWDLLPFIAHKRSSLPKNTLQQLKDAILTGKHSFLASLKEKSGLPVGDQLEHGTRIDDGNCNNIAPRFDANDSQILQRDLPGKIPVPVNRKRSSNTDNVGGGGTFCDNLVLANNGSVKKHKHDVTCSEQYVGKSISPGVDAQLADPSAVSMQHNEGERCHFKGKIHVGNTGMNGLPKKDSNGYTSPKGFVGDNEVPHCEKEQEQEQEDDIEEEEDSNGDYCNPTKVNRDMDKNVGEWKLQDDGVDLDKSDQDVSRNTSNVDEAEEGDDVSSDCDLFHEEETNIDTKRKTFLSSQCTYSLDSLATTDWTELNLCMKCSKGRKLLVCSSDSCPLVIHDSCLGSDASYDTSGKFYCPFCAYSQAISRYTDIKKKASLARKDLAVFVCSGIQKKSKDLSHRSCRIKQNNQKLDTGSPTSNNSKGDCSEKVVNPQQRKELENEGAGPSELHPGHGLPSRGRAKDSVNSTVLGLDKGKQEGTRTREVSRSLRFHGERTLRSDDCKDRTNIRSKKGVLCPPETYLYRRSNSQSVDSEGTYEKKSEREDSGTSKYFIRAQKRKKYSSYSAIPHLRRNTLPWTKEEEEALKEGVQKFSDPIDRTKPWTHILEFGSGVFNKSRTTVDLKDKWRNMCKAASKV